MGSMLEAVRAISTVCSRCRMCRERTSCFLYWRQRPVRGVVERVIKLVGNIAASVNIVPFIQVCEALSEELSLLCVFCIPDISVLLLYS